MTKIETLTNGGKTQIGLASVSLNQIPVDSADRLLEFAGLPPGSAAMAQAGATGETKIDKGSIDQLVQNVFAEASAQVGVLAEK